MKIKKLVAIPMGIAGASVGMGILGEQLSSTGLKEAGETAGKFISPAISISMGGYLINQLKSIRPPKKHV